MTARSASTEAVPETQAGAPGSTRRWWALAAIAASVLVVGLDLTVLTLALPTMAVSLHASTGDLQWITDAYSLVIAAAMLPAGLLGDRYGRKLVLLVALALFGVSSALCALASSTGELIAARVLLGIGAAAIFPMALSVIPVMFAPQERQKAVAMMAGATFLSFPIGPLVGGFLLDHFWWGSVFLINVPVVVIALAAVVFLLPESRSSSRPGVDALGVVVSSAGLVALTYGCIKAGQNGWGDAAALATIAVGVLVLAVFVLLERRVSARGGQPLMDLVLFRSVGFRWGTILATLVSFAMFGLFFAMPQYFQDVRGADALGSGLRLLPLIGGMLVGMIGGTRLLSPRKRPGGEPVQPAASPKLIVTVGFVVMAVALAGGALTTLSSSTGYAAAWIAVAGLGLGLALPSAMNVALGALSAERSGSGSALISALRQVGATIGVAVLGTLISNGYGSRVNLHGLPAAAAGVAKSGVAGGVQVARALGSAPLLDSVRAAFVHGMDLMLWACGGIALLSAALALIFLPGQSAGTETGPEPATDLAAEAAAQGAREVMPPAQVAES
jgi:MFS transporter, DHA2 family, multidrug resistance protein